MRTIIQDVRLVDGTGDAPRDRATVVVKDGAIARIGANGDVPNGEGERIDGRGMTLLPGLIDCHAHLMMGRRGDAAPTPGQEAVQGLLHGIANLRRCFDAGVTAVRDLGWRDAAVVEIARAVERGELTGPEIIAAARFIAPTDGYIAGMAREASGPEDARRAAEEQVAAGARVLKAIASPVPPRPGERPVSDSFGVASLRAVAEVAHAAGLRVTAHAHGLAGARDAIEAGVDCIEHGYRLDEATVARMAGQGTWLVPTMVAMEAAQAPQWAAGRPDEGARRARERWDAAVEAVRLARRAGVRIATGTDGPAVVPTTALHREVALLVGEGGFTPIEALHAATGAAAALLGINDRTGTLAAGMRADLLLVAGDPASDPACLAAIRGVWRGGVRVG